MLPRLIAPVGPLVGELRTRHLLGPPDGPQNLLPYPQLVVIEEEKGGGAYLFRYTASGEFGGDTWHESIADAKDQAVFEYQSALGEWYEVPASAVDPVAFALNIGLVARVEP